MGGFIGVDVFFVISGYLVTLILLQQQHDNNFSFAEFYQKRIRRLLPSLILVLFTSLTIGYVILLSNELKSLGLHTFFASLFSSNFLLTNEVGYFDSDNIFKPLLHLWSLSVEEQFYLLWPLLIWSTLRFKKTSLKFALIIVISLSFLFNLFYIQLNQSVVFYSVTGRFWQLGCGGVLAYLSFNKNIITNKLSLNFLSLLGLLGLLFSVFKFKYDIHYPGVAALLPTLSASLLIYAGAQAYVNQFFSQKYIVYIGLISYPLYLWHWPLLSLTHIFKSQEVSSFLNLALILLSLCLSIFSFECIEKPLRKKQISWRLTFKITLPLGLAGIIGFVTYYSDGFANRYPAIESVLNSRKTFQPNKYDAENIECQKKYFNAYACAITNTNQAPTVVVLGDSHAGPTYYGLKKYYTNKSDNLLLLSSLATPPLIDTYVFEQQTIKKSFDDIFNYVLKSENIHTVILSAFWSGYHEDSEMISLRASHKYKTYDKIKKPQPTQQQIFEINFRKTLNLLIQHNKKVVIVYNVPLINFNINKCLGRPLLKNGFLCVITKTEATSSYADYQKIIAKLINEFPETSIKIFNPIDELCKNEVCPLIQDDKLIYADTNHLTLSGAEYIFNNYNF